MSYKAQGTGRVSQYKQEPKALPKTAFNRATLPAVGVIQPENATHVIINGQTSGSYFFATKVTGSAGATVGPNEFVEAYNTAGAGADASPVTLPINATAWSGSGGPAVGAVTFVVRGGL
jgi:hypothetical protein